MDGMCKAGIALLALVALVLGGCRSSSTDTGAATDPPLLVPWSRIGDIALDESRPRVEREYGPAGHSYHVLQRYGDIVQGYYRLHGSQVVVTFYGRRVGELAFQTPYYRTKDGFGVGSKIPLGACHRTATNQCEHHWHGFVFDAWNRGTPCNCWVKVGLGARSLRVTAANFSKPWFFIYTRRGRVTRFYFALKFID
jgi:hypothetical protein